MVRVAVLECGLLGSKIAGDLAYHGHEVYAYDSNPGALDKLLWKLADDTEILRKDGLLGQPNLADNVLCMSRLEEAVRNVDFVFEAIVEDLESKSEFIAQVSSLCPTTAIIGSNSRHLNIDSVFERATGKDRCLGVRFLFPAFSESEVELQITEDTAPECLTSIRGFLEHMGKSAFFRDGNFADFNHHVNLERELHSEITDSLPQSREKDCVVCLDAERIYALHPCHHLCLCATCGKRLLQQKDSCPICRKQITSVFRIFYA